MTKNDGDRKKSNKPSKNNRIIATTIGIKRQQARRGEVYCVFLNNLTPLMFIWQHNKYGFFNVSIKLAFFVGFVFEGLKKCVVEKTKKSTKMLKVYAKK